MNPMKTRLHFLLILLLVSGSFCAAAPLRVVCIGDSITQGRGNRNGSGAEVDQVPVGGEAVFGGVLAHRRDRDAVA